jgi:hypothetical protein
MAIGKNPSDATAAVIKIGRILISIACAIIYLALFLFLSDRTIRKKDL